MIETQEIGFTIGGDTEPSPVLIAHAQEIVRSFPEFRQRVGAFLAAEALRLPVFAEEIRELEIEEICLFWPIRPDDGMIYFRGPDEFRVWRCDYIGRSPVGLGFDD